MPRPTKPELLGRARRLRAEPTTAETRLWYHLRRGHIEGFKFRRQRPIGPFIVDFVCLEARLIVEVDGSQHGDRHDYDEARTRYLDREGFRVLRFWNGTVLTETRSVVEVIWQALLGGPAAPAGPPT